MQLTSITEQVRDMYTRFPYPPPNVVTGTPAPAMMDYTRFVLWPGRRNFTGMRVLDAGCGTGNTAVSIARAYPEIEVVGIDLSETSLKHARALAREHGVGGNLELHCLPIQEVETLGQRFDYIVSSGVIHHLDDPVRGLRALTDVLTSTGGIFLMLYATYGRAGVYQLQDALRLLGTGADYDERVALARAVVKHLPDDHTFKATSWQDPNWPGDAGLVDLLLHVRDRSYTVPQVYELLDNSGLQLVRFMDPLTYEPATYLKNAGMQDRLATFEPRVRAELAELLCGRMRKHHVFATRKDYAPFNPVPTGEVLLALRPRLSVFFRWDRVETLEVDGQRVVRLHELRVSEHYARQFDLQPWHTTILRKCDGTRTTLAIFLLDEVQAAIPVDDIDGKLDLFGSLMEMFAAQEVILCEP
jgi:2-polyprenyl-3-methyl-5-hydroxy-6-metoxy-1,4-benzoquinol methylase